MESDEIALPVPTNLWLDQLEVPRTSSDSLGREAFARTLADALVKLPNDRSVVTSVFGPWGCGKTWLMERIIRALEDDYPAAMDICRFSPWELKSHDQILGEFFSTVATKIPPKVETQKLAGLWGKLEQFAIIGSLGVSGVISAIQLGQGEGASALPAAFGSFASLFSAAEKSRKVAERSENRQTLVQIKDELTSELRQRLPRPILIVIDDLDRLTHQEIQLIIRLLNTTANLPKLHYLIFGDRVQIASALDPICGNQGDRYLEKLVQNSFQVPEPGENQIRLRLWEGLEKLAQQTREDLVNHAERFSDFWDSFLKFRIINLRDCHRLLRTLAFHVGALTRDGVLEVDLMDLLGIDFLRVFDPNLYHRLGSEHPTKLWCFSNLSGKDKKKDSKMVLDLVAISKLGNRVACGALISLFPHLAEHLNHLLEASQLSRLRYRRLSKMHSPLGICHPERTEIYFRLDVTAGDLPEAKVKEFAGAMDDTLRMIKLLEEFRTRKWLVQLFGRFRSDPELVKDGGTAARLLFAVSAISDQLEDKPGLEDDELRGACFLSDHLIERMAKDGLEREILPAIREAGEFSLALLLIEEMRHLSDYTFFPGAKAPLGLLRLTREEIDALADELLPLVRKSFWNDNFIKQNLDASRAYRMAHALGSVRTEEILRFAIKGQNRPKIWRLVESIAVAITPIIDLDWNEVKEGGEAGAVLLDHLAQFASLGFWESFIVDEACDPPTQFSKLLVEHLQHTIRERCSAKLAVQAGVDGEDQ